MAKDLIPVATPVGELWYVNITGQGKENYNEDGFDYVATLHLTGDDAKKLKAKIDEVLGDVPEDIEVKSTGYKDLLEDDEGVYTPTGKSGKRDANAKPTGITAFSFKTGTTYKDGRATKVNVYNSAAEKIDMGERLIGNGSKGAISGKMQRHMRKDGWAVSLYLNAIQITEYVEYTGDAGFEAQEGGSFVAPESSEGFTGAAEEKPKAAAKTKPRL